MLRFTPLRVSALAAATFLLGAGAVAATGSASASQVNRPPICNNIGFNLPAPIGSQAVIPVLDVAADPDLTPVELVSAFGGSHVGTVEIVDDVLVFTRTSSSTLPIYVYWTVSDGEFAAQCQAIGGHLPPNNG